MKQINFLFLSALVCVSGSAAFGQCNDSQTFNYTGNLQTFVVPAGVTTLTVECYGAKGGNGNQPSSPGGSGAYASGDITVTPGETLNIIAGGMGVSGVGGLEGGGGGGGSFVVRASDNTPLIIAGGGGGGSYQAGTAGQPGSSTTTGSAGGYVPTLPGMGGYSDNGGGGGTGAGGGGWNANGTSNNWATGGIMQGGAGGTSLYIGDGGFGGGGAAYHGGGGGGGYSGGGGGTYTIGGGGGASYNTGSNQTMTAGVNTADGYVVVSWDISYFITESATICYGGSYAFPDGTNQSNITAQVIHTSNLTAVIGGCDSIVETTVDVYPQIDNGATQTGVTITADAITGTYQWLASTDSCTTFTLLGSETNQSYTATSDGGYVVIISENGCSDTSDCFYVSFAQIPDALPIEFSVMPNPASTEIYVLHQPRTGVDCYFELLTITGEITTQVVLKENTQTTIDVSELSPGIYFVRLVSSDGKNSETRKLIIR